jgi:hypothetical protein
VSRSSGTPKGLEQWLRTITWRDESSIELHVLTMEGSELVTSWTREQVTAVPLEWGEQAIQLADADAEGRGQTTRYQFRHVREGRVAGATIIRRVVAIEEKADNFDGTASGLVGKMLGALDKAYSQVLTSAQTATQAQEKSLALLGQSYGMVQRLQLELDEARAELRKGAPAVSSKPDIVDTMVREMAPTVGLALVQKFMPELMGTDETENPS